MKTGELGTQRIPAIPEPPIMIWKFTQAPDRYCKIINDYLPTDFNGHDALLAFVEGGYLGVFHPITVGFPHRCIVLAGGADNAVIVALW